MGRVEVEVLGITRDPRVPSSPSILILQEKEGKRRLPIFIGQPEATVILAELEKQRYARPLTHDLLVNILTALDVQVVEVTIHKLEENIFYAYLLLETSNRSSTAIDCRPSDGVAIALKTQAPIYCEEEVLEKGGLSITDEEEKDDEPTPLPTTSKSPSTSSLDKIEELLRQNLSEKQRAELATLLERELKNAVEQENYEKAARIRDLLRKLEEKGRN